MSVYNLNGEEINEGYTLDGVSLADVYDLSGNRIGFDGSEPEFLDTAILTPFPSLAISGGKQGACTDGTYIYQMAGDSANHTYMQIVKYKIADGTYTIKRYDGTPNFGHANDMTYDQNTGYLYVCTMLDDGSIIVLDSRDLTYVKTVYFVNPSGERYFTWQIFFDRLTRRFYGGYQAGFCIFDENWNYISYLPTSAHLQATTQGCETDGKYIYRVTHAPNQIDVLDMEGLRVKVISLPTSYEPEAMMYDWNGHYYLSEHVSLTELQLYAMQIFEETA